MMQELIPSLAFQPKKGQNSILFFLLADFLPDLRLDFFYFWADNGGIFCLNFFRI